jgi:hypothetical protein
MAGKLQRYWLSKWICPFHGHYTARTFAKVDPNRPILCPECKPIFVDQIEGRTVQALPYVSKPRVPSRAESTPIASDKAPLRKRGAAWRT